MAVNVAQHKIIHLLKTLRFFVITCCNVFNVWPRVATRLDTPDGQSPHSATWVSPVRKKQSTLLWQLYQSVCQSTGTRVRYSETTQSTEDRLFTRGEKFDHYLILHTQSRCIKYLNRKSKVSKVLRKIQPWLMWLSGWSAKGSPVQFTVRAHTWVAGQVPNRGSLRGNHTLMFLSLSFSLPFPL